MMNIWIEEKNDIETFSKNTIAANSGRADNDKILLPHNALLALLAIHFELKDRNYCNALPDDAVLQAITPNMIIRLRDQRSQAIMQVKSLKAQVNYLTDMTIPKLTNSNYDEFFTAFKTMTERVIGAYDIPIVYILHTEPQDNYDAGVFTNREERLIACLALNGPLFQADSNMIYSLFIQHIGTTGIGSTAVNAHRNTRNGRQCFLDLNKHYCNRAYLDGLATKAQQAISRAVYQGRRRNFTLETYFNIMSNAFNDLERAGPAYYLRDEQKVTYFRNGLQEPKAIHYSIVTMSTWSICPAAERTFDNFYNDFSAYMNQHETMNNFQNNNSNRRINTIESGRETGAGRGNRIGGRFGGRGRFSRGGGRGRGRGRFGGRGRGRGRNIWHNDGLSARYQSHDQFRPEA